MGLPEDALPSFTIQLSSPIEEATITKIFDPLDPSAEGSQAKFQGVETSNAILTISVKDVDIPLGVSESIDVGSLCSLSDPTQSEYVTEKEIPITVDSDASDSAVVCSVVFRVTYKPSAKDQREELYELLNKVSERKTKYVGELQQAAIMSHRSTSSTSSSTVVRSGFLNKSPPQKSKQQQQQKKPSQWKRLYEKTIGPQSMIRIIFPVAKNYIIFFGAVILFHFRGQELALPPPV
jgi:hypothetical protein